MKHLKHFLNRILQFFGFQLVRYRKEADLLLAWLKQLENERPITTVFDIGANKGQTVDKFRELTPKATIYAFEPSQVAFEQLEQKANNLTKVFQLALGEYDGSATLFANAADVTNSLLPNSNKITKYAPAEMCVPVGKSEVKITRIDNFCAAQNINTIDILKIDAQGYERLILEGAGEHLNPQIIRAILIEVLFVSLYENQTWFDEIMSDLRTRGYRLFGFSEVSKSTETGWRWANAMFIADDD